MYDSTTDTFGLHVKVHKGGLTLNMLNTEDFKSANVKPSSSDGLLTCTSQRPY